MQHRPDKVNDNLYESFKFNYLNYASTRGEVPTLGGFELYVENLKRRQDNPILTESHDSVMFHARLDPDFSKVKIEDVQRNVIRLRRTIKEDLRRLK